MNFKKDLRDIRIKKLDSLGCNCRLDEDYNKVLLIYENFKFKYIVPQPRIVLKSLELKQKNKELDIFYQSALSQIIEKLQKGDDINPYQTDRLIHTKIKLKFNDDGSYEII